MVMFLGYNDAAKLPPFCGFECVKTMLRRHSAKDWVFRGFGNGLLLNASCTLSLGKKLKHEKLEETKHVLFRDCFLGAPE